MIEKIKPIIAILREHLGMTISVFMHLFLFVFLLISFPQCNRKEPQQIIISIDLLPIAKKTNIKNKEITENKNKEEKPNEKEKFLEKPKPELFKEKKEDIKPEVIPEKKIEEKDALVKKEEKPKPPAEKPTPTPKQEEKKEQKDKPKKKVSEYDSLMKNLETIAKKNDQKEKVENISKGPSDIGMPLSMSIKDSIKRQIEECWNPPAGNKDAAQLKVLLNIRFQEDGTVSNVVVIDNERYGVDELYQVAADAAVRAVYKCSPLKDLPIDQYSMWKNLEFNFDPSDLIY